MLLAKRLSARPLTSSRQPRQLVVTRFKTEGADVGTLIKVGDKLPMDFKLQVMDPGASAPRDVTIGEVFGGKRGVLFGLPGAFTSVCSSKHVPQFFERSGELQDKGVQVIACASVNDAYVMREWFKSLGVDPEVVKILADGEAKFHRELGLSQHLPGLGERARRYSMLLDDGVVRALHLEEPGGMSYKVSGPQTMLNTLDSLAKKTSS